MRATGAHESVRAIDLFDEDLSIAQAMCLMNAGTGLASRTNGTA
jgi:hypothetical protein